MIDGEKMTAFKQYLAAQTPETRAANLAKAREAIVAKALQREANKLTLQTEYMDSGHWATLASDRGVRMPSNLDHTTLAIITKYLKRCNVSRETFNEHYTSSTYFIKNNPRWSAYATAGIILELPQLLGE
jgi:hypothetical protein